MVEVEVSGLGCEPNVSSIQFSGLNCEIFKGGEERDVSAHVAFPLQKNQPGLVAMCDTNALGPEPNQVKFRQEFEKTCRTSYHIRVVLDKLPPNLIKPFFAYEEFNVLAERKMYLTSKDDGEG